MVKGRTHLGGGTRQVRGNREKGNGDTGQGRRQGSSHKGGVGVRGQTKVNNHHCTGGRIVYMQGEWGPTRQGGQGSQATPWGNGLAQGTMPTIGSGVARWGK